LGAVPESGGTVDDAGLGNALMSAARAAGFVDRRQVPFLVCAVG
jgi:hypothetical protein